MRRSGPQGTCTICRHVERGRIDYLAANGASLLPLAKRFGISKDALYRHFHNHVSEDFKRSVALGPFKSEEHLRKLCAESGTSVLENLRSIYGGLAARWVIAFDAGADQTLVLLTTRMHENLEKQARLTKELVPAAANITTNVFMAPAMIELQGLILEILKQFPEAKAALLRAWQDLRGRALAKTAPVMIEGSVVAEAS